VYALTDYREVDRSIAPLVNVALKQANAARRTAA
jgi:hypothetical protein